MTKTSWESVSSKYHSSVGDKGSYYHQKVIIPNSLRLLETTKESRIIDLACGQGVLARNLTDYAYYLGLDVSSTLIETAKSTAKSNQEFIIGDISKKISIPSGSFTHATIILALQNIQDQLSVIRNARLALEKKGKFLIVLNHPYFRIPRHSGWEIDQKNNVQYRRISKYMTPLEIAINHEPSNINTDKISYSYHIPVHTLSDYLSTEGFCINKIEEWMSDKVSVGKNAKRENIGRQEFPMFMAILAVKI